MLKIAVQSPRHSGMVTVAKGMRITREMALSKGYTIAKDEADATSIRATAGDLTAAGKTYLESLLDLPEAKERPLAASRIAAMHTPATMTLAKAGLFLSGLPVETMTAEDLPLKQYPPEVDALLRRKCEIHLMGLNTKALRGDRQAKEDARAIGYGLDLHRSSTLQCVHALKASGVDMDRLRNDLSRMGN